MRNLITHLEVLEEENLVLLYLKDKIDIWYNEDLKVYSEASIYIADLKKIDKK